jgi:hypothetical protein
MKWTYLEQYFIEMQWSIDNENVLNTVVYAR